MRHVTELSNQDQNDLQRAAHAKNIVEDELVLEALASMRRDIFERWADPNTSQKDREEIYYMNLALVRFIEQFDLYLQQGAQARHLLGMQPEEKTFLQRIKEWFK